nr:hypothetical protein [Tanacetum cinerariifolium]
MDFLMGKKYDEILPIFQAKFDGNMRFLFKSREEMEAEDEEIIKSINETPAQKAAKRRKLPVVDYQIVVIDNKPRWIRCYMEKSKECSWFGIGEKIEAVDFMCAAEELMLPSESKDCQSNIDAASLRLKLFKDVVVVAG